MGTAESDGLVGQVVEERYRIVATIGRGAMGIVYKAQHVKVGREVAIKILHDHLLCDPTMVARFDREAALAARIDHQNLIKVIDVGETAAKQKLMVLELARGENLAEIVGRGPLERTRVIHLVTQLLRGLEHAHTVGLVHRDLKPENVIVELDDHGHEVPRIVDFGLAVLRDPIDAVAATRLTAANVILGTPAYMAPEQAQAADPDPRTDLFALGVMVYEMLAGRQPFDGTSMEIVMSNITEDPPPIATRSGAVADPMLEAFARRLMARKLDDRFASARVALEVLALIDRDREAAARALELVPPPRETAATIAIGSPVSHGPARAELPVARPSSRTAIVAGAGAVVLIASVLGLVAPRSPPARSPALELAATPDHPRTSSRSTARESAPREARVERPAIRVNRVPRARVLRASPPEQPAVAPVTAPGETERALIDPGADEVARRYVATGKALAKAGDVDELWTAYRWIRLNDALATSVGRQAALRAIDHIDRELARRTSR